MSRAADIVQAGTNRAARTAMLAALGRLEGGAVELRLPNLQTFRRGRQGNGPLVRLDIHDERAFGRILAHGEIGAGEAYQDGLWSSPDLVSLLELVAWNRSKVDFNSFATKPLRAIDRRLHRRRANTVEGSRENISAHYDLSNAFFGLWLDETMAYSAAVFETGKETLTEAQRLKFRRMAELARIGPGSRVLEIGGGWGGFAIFAAQNYGCHITTITISEAQHEVMRSRVAEAGLGASVEPRLVDYRAVEGTYDAIVSIEMLEAVGAEYYETFFRACAERLRPGGALALQVITLPERRFAAARDGVSWIQKHIFPGGDIPSLAEMERAAAPTDFVVTDVRDIGLDYARTLALWRERFHAQEPAIRALNFDDRFLRTWDYYLALCEAGFRGRFTQDLQLAMVRPTPSWRGG